MPRLRWIVALGSMALAVGATGLLWRVPAESEPTVVAAGSRPAARPLDEGAARPKPRRQPTAEPVAAAAPRDRDEAPMPWSTEPLELQAPTPDQLPCGEMDCLTEDPERYRVEIHGTLAREGLARLLEEHSIDGELADDLRAQLEANLGSFAEGP